MRHVVFNPGSVIRLTRVPWRGEDLLGALVDA